MEEPEPAGATVSPDEQLGCPPTAKFQTRPLPPATLPPRLFLSFFNFYFWLAFATPYQSPIEMLVSRPIKVERECLEHTLLTARPKPGSFARLWSRSQCLQASRHALREPGGLSLWSVGEC